MAKVWAHQIELGKGGIASQDLEQQTQSLFFYICFVSLLVSPVLTLIEILERNDFLEQSFMRDENYIN